MFVNTAFCWKSGRSELEWLRQASVVVVVFGNRFQIRKTRTCKADVAAHAQEPVFAKWGYDVTTAGRMEPRAASVGKGVFQAQKCAELSLAQQACRTQDMYAAMKDLENDESIKAKQLEVANLWLGLTSSWAVLSLDLRVEMLAPRLGQTLQWLPESMRPALPP